jgi:hypothetical protein
VAWLNGHNLGRYWPARGPQMSLYAPGELLRPGRNELLLLELHPPAPAPLGQPGRVAGGDEGGDCGEGEAQLQLSATRGW